MTTAWVFAGHGAQYPGMGRSVLSGTEAGRRWLAAAENASGLPLGEIALHGPARRLIDPVVLEPLLAAVSGAYVDLLAVREAPPEAVAGYSAGHVPALYAAGVIDRDTSIQIACIRGAVLSRAAARVPGGMVAAHGLPEQHLTRLAMDDAACPASIAARNAPMHVIYAGRHDALARAAARATKAGAVVSDLLDIAGPWHTNILEPERVEIETMIAGLPFRPAARPVFSTVTAAATQDADILRWTVAASVVRAVEWHATVRAMRDAGIDAFVEVSPGRSIWGLLGQQQQPFGFSRHYQECVRGPARGTARINRGTGFSVPRQPLLAQVPA